MSDTAKETAQHPANNVPTNTTKPVEHMTAEKLEQNTPMGKFSGNTSEAK